MSGRVGPGRIDETKKDGASIGGVATDIGLVSAKDYPFRAEYHATGSASKSYGVGSLDGDAPKTMWAVLAVKRRSYGSALMSLSNRGLAQPGDAPAVSQA